MGYKEVAGGICAPKGFAAAGVHCGIRANHTEKYDLALIKADVRCAAAGVYTTNKVCGAPIKVDRAHLADGYAQAIVVNSGNANTCAANGVALAEECCELVGKALGIAQSDAISEELTLSFTLLEITPTGLEGRFDSRVPLCAAKENCSDVAEAAFARYGFALSGEMHAPHHTPAESPFVQTLLQCYESYTGLKGECLTTGGGTYVHSLEGGVSFGAAFEGTNNNMHGPDEFALKEHLLVTIKMYAQVICDLCK